mgnify:CR=1 FL=1
MTQYWLGLDCGGSWLKAGLYDREGREAGVQRLPLCALSPQPGWAERDQSIQHRRYLFYGPGHF